jgi:hypothetical protein
MTVDREPKDAIAFVREIVRSAVWNVVYHKHALPKAYADLNLAKEMARLCGFDEDAADRARVDDDNEDYIFDNIEEFAGSILCSKENSVKYHEDEVKKSHDKMAFVTILLSRGKYTEIDIAEIEAEVEAKLVER